MYDTSKIEGFDQMTDAEKMNALLERLELFDGEIGRQKSTITRITGEAADRRRAAKETEDKLSARDADYKALQGTVEDLQKQLNVQRYAKRFMGFGYSEELATSAAEAMANGDTDAMFDNIGAAITKAAENARVSAMHSVKGVEGVGSGTQKMTREEIYKITDPVERQNAIAANMEIFKT